MIKNIVFDMGGVLMDFDGRKQAAAFCPEGDQELFYREVFGSEEWKLLDEGMITYEAAEESILTRLPLEMAAMCREALAHWQDFMQPLPEMNELAVDLKKAGYRLYLCSNASLRFHSYRDRIPALKEFDGVLLSAEEKCLKPAAKIFHRLYQKFALDPQECFFIDDVEANIAGAKETGMDGIVFSPDKAEVIRGRFL